MTARSGYTEWVRVYAQRHERAVVIGNGRNNCCGAFRLPRWVQGDGTEVEATIDWARRERHMRLHTSQHYLSARIFARYGARTRRASLRGREAVIELDRALPFRAIEELGEDAARMASDPRHVRIREVPRVEWDRHPTARSSLVALAPGVDPVRLIEIEGIDLCPCGGTHVRSTSEVGELEIRPVSERDEGGTRFSYVLVNGGGTTPPE